MDESSVTEAVDFELQTDILTLLENVKCQGNNPFGLKQALLALANIFSSDCASQEYFYLTGGVEELQKLLLEGNCPLSVVPAALYCLACAVRQNVTSQKAVLTERMFSLIHELLSHSNSSDRLLQSAAFLLAYSVAGSNKGQLLAAETGCLQDLVNLLRDFMATGSEDENTWSSVTRAIAVCVNNPRNAHNQQVCCSMLPHTLKFVSTETRHACLGHVFTLISSIVANNVANQNRIRRCGGIEMLMNFIRYQVGVEMTPLSLNLVVSAVSAVDACIADNEECGVQAATLGLVQIVLDLLQTNNLELNHTQVFIITLAHILESSNDYCQLVNGGKGYYTLVNYLTECQDEELFKVIKYILTLCKTQGAHEPSDGQSHIDVHDKDYDDNPKQSKRDLTDFMNKGLTALSNQLSSIKKISEGIQWMTDVNRSAQPAVGSIMPPIDTPGNHSNTDQMPPHYTKGVNIIQFGRQDCRPGQNSLNGDRKCQKIDISHSDSFASVVKKSDSGTRQVVQNSFLGNSVHTDCDTIVGPQDRMCGPQNVEVEIKCSRVDSNCKHVQDGGIDNRMKPNHGALAQALKNYSPASSNFHRPNTGRSEQTEHLNCCQGLSKHTNSMSGSKISQIHSQEHWSTKHGHDFQMHKEGRSSSYCEKKSNSACLEDQVSYQKHKYQGVDRGNAVTSPWSVKGTMRQHSNDGKQHPYEKNITLCPHVQNCCDGKPHPSEKKITLFPDVHDFCDGRHAVTNCSPRSNKTGQQNYEIGESLQSPALGQQPIKHHKESNDTAHEHIAYVQNAQDSCGCKRSCDRNVHPRLRASPARYTITHSTPKSSSSSTRLQHFADVQITPELSTEQILEVSKGRNNQQEDNYRASVSPHENQRNLLSQLQKVISDLFKSLLPGQVTTLHKPNNHSSPAAQLFVDQCPNSSEIAGSCVSPCQSLLSLCGDCDLQDEDQQQKMSHTTTKQALADPVSELKNISVIVQPLSEIQKDDDIQAISACSNCEKGCSVRDNTVDYNDGGRTPGKTVSNKTVDENKIFVKPSQPRLYVPRTTVNHKAAMVVSNTRLAGTPGTPLTTHITQPGHPPPVSPALSLFDCQLKSLAFRNTTGVSAGLENTFTHISDDSTSGFESTCSAEAISNMVPALSSPESQVDGHTCKTSAAVNQVQSSGSPSSQIAFSTKQESFPRHQHSLKFVNTQQSFDNQLSRTQVQCFPDTGGNKRKSAALINKRMHKKKKAILAGCSPQYSKYSSCPGCCAGLKLNSCTYNIAIETNPYTCAYHRHVRQCERTYISQLLPNKQTLTGPENNLRAGADAAHDVYEFQSSSEEHVKRTSVKRRATSQQQNVELGRRLRVAYTEQEVLNLLEAVHQMGKHWQQILWTYQFHPSRTAVDLKDKYRQLQTKESKQTAVQLPFSLCEIRRLKNGVKQLGYNWQAILKCYKFLPGRTAADLHTKWRSLNTVESFSDGVNS